MIVNLKAFLDMLAWSEGVEDIGDRGYNVLVGSTLKRPLLFPTLVDGTPDYRDHPRIYNRQFNSTAAGRYQLLTRYYDAYKKKLNLPDFSPASQDIIAIQQIKEEKALSDIETGDIQSAIAKCSNIWASLPGNNYGQHQQKWVDLRKEYLADGGVLKPSPGSPPVG